MSSYKIPWWIAFLASAGFGGMSAFAGNVLPLWVQVIGFIISAGLFLIGVAAAAIHYGWLGHSSSAKFDMPFRDVVRRVALHTEWGLTYTETHWPTWQDELKAKVRGPLADGDVHARGKHDKPGQGEATARTDIPRDFWAYSDFDVLYLLVSNHASMAYKTGEPPVEVITDIVMNRDEVNRAWPSVRGRKRKGRLSPFAKIARERFEELECERIMRNPGVEFHAAFDEYVRRGKGVRRDNESLQSPPESDAGGTSA